MNIKLTITTHNDRETFEVIDVLLGGTFESVSIGVVRFERYYQDTADLHRAATELARRLR